MTDLITVLGIHIMARDSHQQKVIDNLVLGILGQQLGSEFQWSFVRLIGFLATACSITVVLTSAIVDLVSFNSID
jgi:hypothetical protein